MDSAVDRTPADWSDDDFAPLLICSNLQKAVVAVRPIVAGAGDEEPALERCAELIAYWRSCHWPVAHLKRIAQPDWFGPRRDQCDWIDEFRPHPGELTFEHALPSAFSSARFADYARNVRPSPCLLVGGALDETILATTIDGYHRGHRFSVVEDAVLCGPRRPPGDLTMHHMTVLHIIQMCADRIWSETALAMGTVAPPGQRPRLGRTG